MKAGKQNRENSPGETETPGQTDRSQQKNLIKQKSALIPVDDKILEKQQKLRNQMMELSKLENVKAIGRKDKR